MVAGQQQMRAIVDRHVRAAVVIGPAAAARLQCRFMHGHRPTGAGQAHRGGKARHARADDMDRAAIRRRHVAQQPIRGRLY